MRTPHRTIDGWFQSRRIIVSTYWTDRSCQFLIADMLPARDLFKNQQTVLVACVEKMRRLRIMRRADDIALQLLSQYPRVTFLHPRRHRLTDKRKRLMSIESAQFQMLAIEIKSLGVNFASRKPMRIS